MNLSWVGLSKLKIREALRLEAYQDDAGVWTIGYGHTKTAKEGMVVTEYEAEILLRRDLKRFVEAVNKVKVYLSQNQFDTLVSFAFNVGVGAFKSSTLLEELNEGNYHNVPDELMRWNKVTVNGQKRKSAGLVYRRVAECAQWYEPRIAKEFSL